VLETTNELHTSVLHLRPVREASRLAAVVLVPLYTRTLSITDYGRLELLLALHALVVILSGLQTESSIAREFFEAG
jgi:O-antigen/teichoic acid export membrane protein